MGNDYLWDRSGPPDPDVERLERLLGRLRSAPPVPGLPESTHGRFGPRAMLPLLATAATIALLVGGTWQATRSTAPWDVARVHGQPRIESTPVDGTARIAVGQTLVTDATSQARVIVSTIGQVTVDANSRVRLVATREGLHQLALERGTLHAFITAPPGQFIVDTPSARATDLGCVYTLHVDEEGGGLLSVTAGWVSFEFKGRESFVPAGASCRTDAMRGPGTPRYDDATQQFRDALDDVDYAGDPARQAAALTYVLEHARRHDAVTLWHLLARVDGRDRGRVFDALAARVPPPPGVMRDSVLRLDGAALDAWWNALGLGSTDVRRKWKKTYPVAR